MSLSFAPYRRAFGIQFNYGNHGVAFREGVILRWEEGGREFFSEASPLESHSQENLEKVLSWVKKINIQNLSTLSQEKRLPPSLRFALEAMDLERAKPPFLAAVETNSVVGLANVNMARSRIQELKSLGYRKIKIKIDPQSIDFLNDLLENEDGIHWRIDGNRSFSEEQLKKLFSSLSGEAREKVEYLEEPLSHWKAPILRESPVPLAVDESVRDAEGAMALVDYLGMIPIFVIKPTVWGGVSRVESFAQLVGWERLSITSTLESEVGRRNILRWLGTGIPISRAAGISNGSLWKENFLEDKALFSLLPEADKLETAWLNSLQWNSLK